MSKDDAFDLMQDALKDVLPSVEEFAKRAKNPAAKKKLTAQVQQIRAALKAAAEAQ